MAKLNIDTFKGINTFTSDALIKPSEAVDVRNIQIEDGELKRGKGIAKKFVGKLASKIETLMVFYNTNTPTILAAAGGKIYKMGDIPVEIASGFSNNKFDYVNFQVASNPVLIFNNGVDPIKVYDGSTVRDLKYKGHSSTEATDNKAPKGKYLELHYGRVWTTKDSMVFFSTSNSNGFDPDDWTIPIDPDGIETNQHGGFIDIPTHDGGKIKGLHNIFDDIIVFKDRNIFKILGTYPGEYEMKRLFSTNGAISDRSICVNENAAYFLENDGIYTYNGSSVDKISFAIDYLFKNLNPSYIENSCGVIHNNTYYLAVPYGDSLINNLIIEYNFVTKDFTIKNGITVESFLKLDNELLFSDVSGYVFKYDVGDNYDGMQIHSYWENGFVDMGIKDAVKRTDRLYFIGSGNGDIKISVITDNTTKFKIVTLTDQERVYRPKISNKGRIIKLRFENIDGSDFTIKKPELNVEVDYD